MDNRETGAEEAIKEKEEPGLFRKKSLERISSPEQLKDYIHVTTPGVWFVLLAITVLLAGVLVWAAFGTMEVHNAAGELVRIAPMDLVTSIG